eukprot:361061-Prymnesium_polylepis.2
MQVGDCPIPADEGGPRTSQERALFRVSLIPLSDAHSSRRRHCVQPIGPCAASTLVDRGYDADVITAYSERIIQNVSRTYYSRYESYTHPKRVDHKQTPIGIYSRVTRAHTAPAHSVGSSQPSARTPRPCLVSASTEPRAVAVA